MIRRIEALNFRCLRYIKQNLSNFHVLVGPNASGKTTFLDVVAFLGELVSKDMEAAITQRTNNFEDLVWKRSTDHFEIAVEFEIPEQRRRLLVKDVFDTVRYEIRIGLNKETREIAIIAEKVTLKVHPKKQSSRRSLFPMELDTPDTIISRRGIKNNRTIVNKSTGNDKFYDETTGKGWAHSFKLGPRKSALGNLPDDEFKFPVATWLKRTLIEGIQTLSLNSTFMRHSSPPGNPRSFRPDGSNLPWVIDFLYKKHQDRFQEWIGHLQTALPDIETVKTIEREDDRHRYLVVHYKNDIEVPSWLVSDGTLRLLALTLPAYLPDLQGVFLIEEPENGIHPRAVESVFQSLSSVYGSQILMATHSPVILSMVKASQVLCFSKTAGGATDIVLGDEHPALQEWQGETDLGTLFAGGVLG